MQSGQKLSKSVQKAGCNADGRSLGAGIGSGKGLPAADPCMCPSGGGGKPLLLQRFDRRNRTYPNLSATPVPLLACVLTTEWIWAEASL